MSSASRPAPFKPGEATPTVRMPAVISASRTERRKLVAQLPLRVLTVVAVLGRLVFAVLLKVQSGTPSDALFGVWVHSSGYAVSLVILSFAANWGFPIMAGVLAGDMFAARTGREPGKPSSRALAAWRRCSLERC